MKSQVLWEGKAPTENFLFNFATKYDFQVPKNESDDLRAVWIKEKSKFPDIYDGEIIFVSSMDLSSTLRFDVGIMKYSQLVYLARTNQSFKELIGYLSFKIVLYYRDNAIPKYLVGMKATDSQFDPGNWTMPGGLVEVRVGKDSKEVDLHHSVIKEIIEETGLETVENTVYCHLLIKGGRRLGIVMIMSTEIHEGEIHLIAENEEFQPSSLQWLTEDEILALSDDTIHEDVAALKYLVTKQVL